MYSKDLNQWLFHYNIYTHKWHAFKREDYLNYFNGNRESSISSSKIDTLVEIIGKTSGDISKLKTDK